MLSRYGPPWSMAPSPLKLTCQAERCRTANPIRQESKAEIMTVPQRAASPPRRSAVAGTPAAHLDEMFKSKHIPERRSCAARRFQVWPLQLGPVEKVQRTLAPSARSLPARVAQYGCCHCRRESCGEWTGPQPTRPNKASESRRGYEVQTLRYSMRSNDGISVFTFAKRDAKLQGA
jgi:hypothetical protein